MTPERWEQVQQWFNRLVNLPLEESRRELQKLGADDPELRRELEDLLASEQKAGSFLQRAVSEASARTSAVSEQRRDRIGQTISHYRIEERLGGGGMGVVYKAHDIRLDRYVALKFLPPASDDDEERLKRLIVEARAASALDHPNICTIHQIDQTSDGHWFIVMAYYQGETVKKRIERAPLSVDEVLDFGIQISQGLVKAHKEGIVHRDLKPANLMVTGDGVIKIVDFGLAQLVAQTKLTAPGTRLGTPAYMSPEQAQGQPLDHRTDIWSLGIVLYEMLAGRAPFKGEYELAVIYSIVNEEPAPVEELRADAPSELVRLVKKALSKDPADRYQQVEDLLRDLEALKAARTTLHGMVPVAAPASAPPAAVAVARGRSRFVYAGLAAAVAVAIAVILSFLLRDPAAPPSVSSPPAAARQSDAADEVAAGEPAAAVSQEPAPEPEAEAAAAPPPPPPPAAPAAAPKSEAVVEPPARAAAVVRSWPPPSGRWALIVGVEQYADDGITRFRGAARDAAELEEALVRYAGFPSDQVTTLVSGDSALRAPTRANVENYLQSVTRLVQPDDLLLFCFIGHAAVVNGQPVLLPADARPSGGSVAAGSAVRLETVRQAIRNRGIRQAVLLFDGFRQNPRQQDGANAMSARYASALSFGSAPSEPDAFAAFYAASSGERAYEHSSDGGGYFTAVFVEALKGAAADERGRVTLGAVERYLRDVVPKRVMGDLGASALQRPFSEIAGYVRDEVVIATVARRELTQTQPPTQQQARPVDTAAQELVEWTRIRNSDDIEVFEGFLRRYPSGSLRQEAQARIDELKWQAARAANESAALERFLRENPNSRYAAQAQARIKELQPPPPPQPAPAPAPAAKVEEAPVPSEADAIREVLRRYGAAYRAKDVEQVAALWPSLTSEQVRRIADSFRIAVSIQQDLMPLTEPEIEGNRATVRCRRLTRYEDERGPQRPVDEQVAVTLARQQGKWVIQSVN